MANVAGLYNVPSDADELNVWSFNHAVHHRDINRRIYQIASVQLPEYILDPVTPDQSWLIQHQEIHSLMNAILGNQGFDLEELDWKNPNALAGWIFQNAQEHVAADEAIALASGLT